MKWGFIFSGELFNFVYYFFFFGNVSDDDKSFLGILGIFVSCMWKFWFYEERFKIVVKVELKRRELE